MIRVNKITVKVDRKNDDTTISLYKTNNLICQFREDQLGIETFGNSEVSIKAYQAYVRDYVINLIDNDGIEGLYYEPKQNSGMKYDTQTFKSKIKEYLDDIIGDSYEYKFTLNDIEDSMDRYNDKYIKDATIRFGIMLTQYNISFHIIGIIKSGQLCRPKSIIYSNEERQFNITNIKRLVKENN